MQEINDVKYKKCAPGNQSDARGMRGEESQNASDGSFQNKHCRFKQECMGFKGIFLKKEGKLFT